MHLKGFRAIWGWRPVVLQSARDSSGRSRSVINVVIITTNQESLSSFFQPSPLPFQGHHRPALPDLLGPAHPPARLRANATSYVCQHPGFTTVKWSLRVRHGYIWYGLVLNSLVSPVTPFDRLPSAILLNLLVVVGHSADLPQLLLPWLPYGKHGWEKGNSETMLTIFWE